jgi:hypothetical protein
MKGKESESRSPRGANWTVISWPAYRDRLCGASSTCSTWTIAVFVSTGTVRIVAAPSLMTVPWKTKVDLREDVAFALAIDIPFRCGGVGIATPLRPFGAYAAAPSTGVVLSAACWSGAHNFLQFTPKVAEYRRPPTIVADDADDASGAKQRGSPDP